MANVSHHATTLRYRRALYQIRRSISRQVRGMKRQRVVVIAASLFVTGIVICLLVSRTDPRFPKYRYYAPQPRPIYNHMPWSSWIYCRDDSPRAICGTRQTNFSNFFQLPHSQHHSIMKTGIYFSSYSTMWRMEHMLRLVPTMDDKRVTLDFSMSV
jgi:hypothetical protein